MPSEKSGRECLISNVGHGSPTRNPSLRPAVMAEQEPAPAASVASPTSGPPSRGPSPNVTITFNTQPPNHRRQARSGKSSSRPKARDSDGLHGGSDNNGNVRRPIHEPPKMPQTSPVVPVPISSRSSIPVGSRFTRLGHASYCIDDDHKSEGGMVLPSSKTSRDSTETWH